CPDGRAKVVITKTEITILQKVFFDTGKSSIKRVSYDLLNTVATVIKQNPQVTKLRIEGHTDDVGDDESNLQLSKDRAAAVKKYLEERGVASERLSSEGFGEAKPRCGDMGELTKDRRTERKNRRKIKQCRADSRRVEFRIVEIDGEPVEATNSAVIKETQEIE
ncbi:MAG: OmpA family protein, partial [Myxococcota bacterium]